MVALSVHILVNKMVQFSRTALLFLMISFILFLFIHISFILVTILIIWINFFLLKFKYSYLFYIIPFYSYFILIGLRIFSSNVIITDNQVARVTSWITSFNLEFKKKIKIS